jgi:hypothetical protein
LTPNFQAIVTGAHEIILLKKKIAASLHHGLILPLKLLQAFAVVSLRRMTITSVILPIREGTAL